MGLFDNLKKAAATHTEACESTLNKPQNEAFETPVAAAPAMPTSKFEKEDLSSLTNLQVLEKIDEHVNEFKRTPNKMVYIKLSNAVDEFDARFGSIPLSKRGAISQDWSFLKMQRDNIKNAIDTPTNFAVMLADQISSYVGKIYTELCK